LTAFDAAPVLPYWLLSISMKMKKSHGWCSAHNVYDVESLTRCLAQRFYTDVSDPGICDPSDKPSVKRPDNLNLRPRLIVADDGFLEF
jgi:hypothetical protein